MRRIFRLPTKARDVDADVDAELTFHLDARVRALTTSGLTPEEATAQARREFGDVVAARDELREMDRRRVRHARAGDWWDGLRQDARFAIRSLRRQPLFLVSAVLTLALGIGANTAIFSVVDGVLLAPLALPTPQRLIAVGEADRSGEPNDFTSTSAGSFFDWQRQASVVRLGAYSEREGLLTDRGSAEALPGIGTLGGLFEVLGATPLLGRTLSVADEDPASESAIVLSHALWSRLFARDPGVIGRTITLNGTPRRVVGVMPASFRFPDGRAQFWVPLRLDPAARANRDQYYLQVVGRLGDGVSVERARTELATIAARLRRDWPIYNGDLRIVALPLRETIVGAVRTRLLVLMGAVAFVLLITCANLGNLLLARAGARRREIAVRQAIGARSGRLVRQFFTESMVLAIAGGVAGLVVGRGFLTLLLAAQATTNLPRADEITLDGRVLLFTLGTALVAGLLFGTVPAWQLARTPSSEALRQGARGSIGQQWARRVLVVSELALAMVLLTGAGLLLRSFALLERVDPGFTGTRLLTFDLYTRDPAPGFFPLAVERVAALPGVQQVAMVSQLPVTGRGIGAWFNRIDRPLAPGVKPDAEAYRVVTPSYFATIGIPLKHGRLLRDDDRADRPAVVINESLASHYYPHEDPIGKPIYLGAPDNRLFDHAEIVGVIGDTRDAGLASDPLPIVYIPHALMPTWRSFSFVVRTAGDPAATAAAARATMRQLDANAPVRDLRTMDAVLAEAVAPARWSMTLMSVFAAVAVLMAALGVFGVLSFLVTQRRRELGIRIALGAAPGALRQMVVLQGLGLALVGLTLGLGGSLALARLMSGLLYGVAPTDAITYAGVGALLTAIALGASYLPARRATRTDPVVVLRAE
jgi:putative ABC transport system permease protein